MKSVFVEASTVSKAIELAWKKAEKPEEFFVRILQEHSNGFLGFGAQKAKIALFFKNIPKADSLFPVVLKQKEYSSFFENEKIKNPTQLNVVDTDLNKNISLGFEKKKQHNPKHKNKNNHQETVKKEIKATHVQAAPSKQQVLKKQIARPTQNSVLNRPKVAPMNVSTSSELHKATVKKEVTQVLKAVQAQKAVEPQASKPFVQAPAPVKKEEPKKVLLGDEKKPAPRIIQKLKRRPLNTENPGVSGITRSNKSDSKL